MAAKPYSLPLRIRKRGEAFIVEDANETAIAYVYFEDMPTRQAILKRLSQDNAKAVAQQIARALTQESVRRLG
jgi:hypothetical protein